ncbi:uncharacterized protein DUF742 [Tamaricihabitans halophyticus]|uniref:Uncharacterized protein DUF742 n=1 Tax=Tamaricihabitans halophyticus TaxID=1262583 RepID=A0A4R2QFJ6_9PSEU|nr:DUF742 domain-containing protein [Tamaricihabitans halophyticus]TCP47913.1 uncharacterized protein DUF742 [Tamaricihabitans halophyticus]
MSTESGFPHEEPGVGGSARRSREGQGSREHATDAAADAETSFADVLNSLTLDSGRERRRAKKEKKQKRSKTGERRHAAEDSAGAESAVDHAAADTGWVAPAPREEPVWPGESPDEVSWRPDGDEPDAPAAIVRPYAWTGGRTKASYALELETLVSCAERALVDESQLQVEHRSMVDICRQPRSVAEVAALLGVPLGVARVLVSDVADLGLVNVHQTVSDDGAEARLTLMERVLSGLRRL